MAQIKIYQAPPTPIQPTNRGYEAAMVSGRRLAAIKKEGSAEMSRGIAAIGSQLEQGENRKNRAEDKAQRQADKEERAADRAQSKAETAQRRQDAQDAQNDIYQGVTRRRLLNDGLRKELNDIVAKTPPEQLPQALAAFEERKKTAFDDFEQGFSTDKGRMFGARSRLTDESHITTTMRADQNTGLAQAAMTTLGETKNGLVQRVLADPSAAAHAKQEWHDAVNAVVGHTPAGQGGAPGATGPMKAATPEEVTPAMLDTFRALEGNKDGHNDHAVSPSGAIGRYQIMPQTASDYGFDPSRLQDTAYNEQVAKAIISDLSKRFDGDPEAMAIGYHSGPRTAETWVAAGRDDKVLGPRGRQYVQHMRDLGNTGAVSTGVGGNAKLQAQLEKTHDRGLGEITAAQVMGTADKDPAAARAMLKNDPDVGRLLTPQQQEHLGGYITKRENDQTRQQAHDQYSRLQQAAGTSTVASMDYVRQLRGSDGNLQVPEGWVKAVTSDQRLRPEEQNALQTLGDRIGAQRNAATDAAGPGWVARQFGSVGQTVNPVDDASNGAAVTDVLKGMFPGKGSGKPALTTADMINRIANPNLADTKGNSLSLSTHDAEMLMNGINPTTPGAEESLKGLRTMLDTMHTQLAPPNPDGSRNVAGEAAYDRALGNILPQARAAIRAGSGQSAFTPGSPEYLLRDNKVQQYAATHEDIAQAHTQEGMPSEMQMRQQYNDMVTNFNTREGQLHANDDKYNRQEHQSKVQSYEDWKAFNYPQATPQRPLGEIFPSSIFPQGDQPEAAPTATPEGTPPAYGGMVLQNGQLVPVDTAPATDEEPTDE